MIEFGNELRGDLNLLRKVHPLKMKIYEDFLDEQIEAVLLITTANLMDKKNVEAVVRDKVRII